MILPLKNSIPNAHRPYASLGIMLVTAAVFLYQQNLAPTEFILFIREFGLIPAKIAAFERLETFVTYTFLHSSWWHIISNIWIFWIFAGNVEDVTGPWRFLAFYLICGVVAGLFHVIGNGGSPIPVVGASGAVSGVLGACFLLYPHAKVTTFVFLMVLRLPATVYLGGWFLLQITSALTRDNTGVAWWAHVGGFVAGALLLPLFKTNRPVPMVIPRAEPPPPPDDPSDPWARYRSK